MATPNNPVTTRSEEAMNRVLAAERDALAEVSACAGRAAAIVDAARQQARHIAQRTDARISRLHAQCNIGIGKQVEAMLHQEHAAADSGAPPQEDEVLHAAVERLAALLTGTATSDEG